MDYYSKVHFLNADTLGTLELCIMNIEMSLFQRCFKFYTELGPFKKCPE